MKYRYILFLLGCKVLMMQSVWATQTQTVLYSNKTSPDSITNYIYSFPSPDELMAFIKTKELEFIPDYLVEPSNLYLYDTDHEKLLLLGIYMADMAYCTMLNESTRGVKYIDNITKIAEELSLYPFIDDVLKDRMITNLGNVDSLTIISTEIHKSTVEFLWYNERFSSYAVISLSSIVESLFLLLNSYDLSKSNDILNQKIVDQKGLFSNLDEMLFKYADNEKIMLLRNELQTIILAYKKIIEDKEARVIETPKGIIIIGQKNNQIIDKEKIIHLRKEINKLRYKWIKNE
nr:hypothetical protein [uncultured Carboxylicivirga sp.]